MSKMKSQIKPTPVLKCGYCGGKIIRKRYLSGNTAYPKGRLEDRTCFLKRKYCSKKCQNAALIKKEVTKGEYRHRAQKYKKSCCEHCGSVKKLQVHHQDKNIKNNSPKNLLTLCASCHNTLHWKERKENGE